MEITDRVICEAKYMIKTNDTIREVAKAFAVSKSTVHKDLRDRLPNINNILYEKVVIILKQHIALRHIKGGQSTKKSI